MSRSDEERGTFTFVMPGLDPGINVLLSLEDKDVDGRDRPGHDAARYNEVVT
jgi:hypothetical protein